VNNTEPRRIEEQLTPGAVPDPPEGLLERIQEDIPGYLQVVPDLGDERSSGWKLRLMAASAVLLVAGAAVVYRVVQQAPTLEERLTEEIVPRKTAPESPDAPEVITTVGALHPTDSVVSSELVTPPVSTPEPLPDHEDKMSRIEGEGDVAEPQSMRNEQVQRVQIEVGLLRGESESARRDRAAEVPQREEAAPSVEEAPQVITVTSESPLLPEAGKPGQRPTEKQALGLTMPGHVSMTGPDPGKRRLDRPVMPSTGGTAEPNDAAYGDMFFQHYGTNPFVDTEDDPLSTFGLDVDSGSFTLARNYLDEGHLPPPEAIRVEEFVNYLDYGDPAPRKGEFTLIAEGSPSPFATGAREQLVRFAIKAREVVEAERQPAILIFVVDVSGSMQRENRLGLVKHSLGLLLDQLRHDDRIGLVIYGSRGEVLLEPTASKEAIRRAIERLAPGGSTNAEEGLDLAYGLARRYYREGVINRVILCSDGVANVGRTGADSILSSIRVAADEGIELTTVGFGMGNYNDVLMEQLADQGDGAYAYVDTLEEARRIFVENLTGTLQTIAADTKAQVEFNREAVSRYRLLGYENRDIADERFRDDTVDAGEIGSGHAVTALYEIKLHENVGRRARLATFRLRYRSKATDEMVESSIDLRLRDLAPSWERASTQLQLSSLAAEFAEILKGAFWAKDSDLQEVSRRLEWVADDGVEGETQDLLDLVNRARQLSLRQRESIVD
jgi:Ca-activated chloride channel family protein